MALSRLLLYKQYVDLSSSMKRGVHCFREQDLTLQNWEFHGVQLIRFCTSICTFPYKIGMMHVLADCDREQRLHCAPWARCEEHFLCSTWFLDEAYFHFHRVLNKQNIQFWAMEFPYQFHKDTFTAKWLFCEYTLQATE